MSDLNSVPPSSRIQPISSQESAQLARLQHITPSDSNLHILPSNQHEMNHSRTSSTPASAQVQGVQRDHSPGPLRHPKPITVSQLHMELEREQEQVVNRLSQELAMLRDAQNASVASTTSASTPASTPGPILEAPLLSTSGFPIPKPVSHRHHRTSSSASQTANISSSHDGRRQPISLSRQNSTMSRTSQTSSSLDPSSYMQQQRVPLSSSNPSAVGATSHISDPLSPGMMPATLRYEETQHFKNELEGAKRENEILKKKIRELEKQVQEQRARSVSRARSESADSTTASMSVAASVGTGIAGPRESLPLRTERGRGNTISSLTSNPVGVPEDEVKVGESAASSGLTSNSK